MQGKARLFQTVAVTAVLSLAAACQGIRGADEAVSTTGADIDKRLAELKSAQRGGVIKETTPWYGDAQAGVIAPIRAVSPFPARLEAKGGVAVTLRQPATIRTIAKAVQDASGYPVRIRTRYPAANGQVNEIPINGTMRITHRGGLSDLLDAIASRFDLAWSFDGYAIRFDRMKTTSYAISLPIQTGAFSTSAGAALSGNRSATFTSQSEQDPWAELAALASSIAPPPSVIIVSKDTGRLTVTAPPSVPWFISNMACDKGAKTRIATRAPMTPPQINPCRRAD